MQNRKLNRRAFLASNSKAGFCILAAPTFHHLSVFGGDTANNKLSIACIGLGGQMRGLLKEIETLEQNVVAICDVDARQLDATRKAFDPFLAKAKLYKDYRQLLEREQTVDAVVIATPDHWHASLCTAAIKTGKHVYCEKPLTHSVGEARQLRTLANGSKVVTQTGNQGAASSNFRRSLELIQAGVLGPISEIHIWHPPHGWPSGVDRPPGTDPVPEGLDWDFWIGPAPLRPYRDGKYHPFIWRGWYDFGGGSVADFCCHAFSLPVRALNLDYPSQIKVSGVGLAKDSFPASCTLHFTFPARAGRGPVQLHFYTGGDMPPAAVTAAMKETHDRVPSTGCLLRGERGTLSAGLWNNECFLNLNGEREFRPASDHEAAKGVPQSLPRAPQERHMLEWILACKGGPKTFSPFEIGGHVTEIGAAGLIALRLGRDIEWEGETMRVKDCPAADPLVRPPYRKGWEIPG